MKNLFVVMCFFCALGLEYGVDCTHEETKLEKENIKHGEQQSHTITVVFYLTSIDEWKKNIIDVLRETVITEANKYCTNLQSCGLLSSLTFIASNLQFIGEPEQISSEKGTGKSNLKIKCLLNFPREINGTLTHFILSGKSLIEIVANSRSKIYDVTGFSLTGIQWGGTSYSYLPYSSYLLNAIIVPVAIVTLLLMFGLCLGLRSYQGRRSRRHQMELRAEFLLTQKMKVGRGRNFKKVQPSLIDETCLPYHFYANGNTKAVEVNEQGNRIYRKKKKQNKVLEHMANPGKPSGRLPRLPPLTVQPPVKVSKKRNKTHNKPYDNQSYIPDMPPKYEQAVPETVPEETETEEDTTSVTRSESTVYTNTKHQQPKSIRNHYEKQEGRDSAVSRTETETESETETEDNSGTDTDSTENTNRTHRDQTPRS